MRAVSSDPDYLDRFKVVIDPDAEPVDWDEALAEFLLRLVEQRGTDRFSPALVAKQTQPRTKNLRGGGD